MSLSDEKPLNFDRRSFLKAAGIGAAAMVLPGLTRNTAAASNSNIKQGIGVTGKLIDMEAHFNIKEHYEMLLGKGLRPLNMQTLFEMGKNRLAQMDENGIKMQVLSQDSGVQMLEPAEGLKWSEKVNNALSEVVLKHPNRFVGLASVAPQSPDAAAKELERAVTELGLKGVNLHSHARNEYLDHKKFRPLFEKAQDLDVPIYLHPAIPSTKILKGYEDYRLLSGPVLGFAAETSLHAMRLILSGLFDEYPKLKIILGHMGEGLPYFLDRIDFAFKRADGGKLENISKRPSDYIKENFFITTSGMFFEPAFLCAYLAIGADNIGFAVDYPHEDLKSAVKFIKNIPVSDNDKDKICSENAMRLFKLGIK